MKLNALFESQDNEKNMRMLQQLQKLVKEDYPDLDTSYPDWASDNGNPTLHVEYVVPEKKGGEGFLIAVQNKGRWSVNTILSTNGGLGGSDTTKSFPDWLAAYEFAVEEIKRGYKRFKT